MCISVKFQQSFQEQSDRTPSGRSCIQTVVGLDILTVWGKQNVQIMCCVCSTETVCRRFFLFSLGECSGLPEEWNLLQSITVIPADCNTDTEQDHGLIWIKLILFELFSTHILISAQIQMDDADWGTKRSVSVRNASSGSRPRLLLLGLYGDDVRGMQEHLHGKGRFTGLFLPILAPQSQWREIFQWLATFAPDGPCSYHHSKQPGLYVPQLYSFTVWTWHKRWINHSINKT